MSADPVAFRPHIAVNRARRGTALRADLFNHKRTAPFLNGSVLPAPYPFLLPWLGRPRRPTDGGVVPAPGLSAAKDLFSSRDLFKWRCVYSVLHNDVRQDKSLPVWE